MTSSRGDDLLDLERGLRVTPEDVVALRRAREIPLSPEERAQLLTALPEATSEELRRRPLFRGTPFRLAE